MIRRMALVLALTLLALRLASGEPGDAQRDRARKLINDAVADRMTSLEAERQLKNIDVEAVIPVLEEMSKPSDGDDRRTVLAFSIAAGGDYARTTSGTLLLLRGLESKKASIRSVSAIGLRSAPESLKTEAGEALLHRLKTDESHSVKNSILLALRALPDEARKGVDTIIQEYQENPRRLRNAPSTLSYIATAQEWFAAVKGVSESGKFIDIEAESRPAILSSISVLAAEGKYPSLSEAEKNEVLEFIVDSLHFDDETVRRQALESSSLIVFTPPDGSPADQVLVQAWREQAKRETNPTLKTDLEHGIEGATEMFETSH